MKKRKVRKIDSQKLVELIPPKIAKQTQTIRTAVYCCVSTKDPRQEGSLENQISHYTEVIGSQPDKVLTKAYSDFGISGYKESRPGFQEMLRDAENGCFDLLITKSITRFARNTDTVLSSVRRLKELGIDVFFELQGIHTLSAAGELLMTLYAAFGQAESEGARRHTQMAIRQKYENGDPAVHLHHSLGYSKDENGDIVPNEDAVLVIMIFEMLCDGFTVAQITTYLNAAGYQTQNHCRFTRTGVTRILRNPAYMGDYIFQRFFVNDDRKLVRNRGELPMYIIEQDHIPIISTILWKKAQDILDSVSRKAVPTERQALPLDDGNYPYRKYLHCAKCGHNLVRAVRANRVLWECGGKKRFSKDFCSGVCATDDEIAALLPITENLFFFRDTDRGKPTKLKYLSETEWKKEHTEKNHVSSVPPLDDSNYPYKDNIFCKYCGNPLRRIINRNNTVSWICSGYSRMGKNFCKGVRVPDEKLLKIRTDIPIYIGKEVLNGKESYGYSRLPERFKYFSREKGR